MTKQELLDLAEELGVEEVSSSNTKAEIITAILDNQGEVICNVNTDIAADFDLLGKTIGDLQTDVVFGENAVTGTLKYVTGYTGFDESNPENQQGNYIAFKSETPNLSTETITVEVVNGYSGPVTLDSDGVVVLRIADKDTQSIRVTATRAGLTTWTKTYDISGLTVQSE
jgi:hypothetical protein